MAPQADTFIKFGREVPQSFVVFGRVFQALQFWRNVCSKRISTPAWISLSIVIRIEILMPTQMKMYIHPIFKPNSTTKVVFQLLHCLGDGGLFRFAAGSASLASQQRLYLILHIVNALLQLHSYMLHAAKAFGAVAHTILRVRLEQAVQNTHLGKAQQVLLAAFEHNIIIGSASVVRKPASATLEEMA